MSNEEKERLTPMQAAERIRHYCAYAERCHQDVRNRLYQFGLNSAEIDQIIAGLIEENFLNEERFAMQYAGGHFRQKGWGRVKIKVALRQKGVSDYCIKLALRQIEEEAYQQLLEKLARQKWQQVRTGTPAQRWQKTRLFLLQRGFEPDLVQQQLKALGGPAE
ncbi:MAG: RecX family transcriptional regulator [Chitinophagaceae bacterium]|nr:RecX family transcriptional regulator [Chitinophagaceae bacterium]